MTKQDYLKWLESIIDTDNVRLNVSKVYCDNDKLIATNCQTLYIVDISNIKEFKYLLGYKGYINTKGYRTKIINPIYNEPCQFIDYKYHIERAESNNRLIKLKHLESKTDKQIGISYTFITK